MLASRVSPRRAGLAAALLAASCLAGCGPSEVANSPELFKVGSLEEVADLYRSAGNQKKKPPASLKDLARNRDVFTNGYNAIANGEVVVYWGVEMLPGEQAGSTDEVLAYNAEVPAEGGPVLLKDGTIKPMSADEFAAAPKPAGPTSAEAK